MIRRLAALLAVWGMVLAGPTLVGPAVPVVAGHAQLVTSTPGAGDVVATGPSQIRLVFSEPIDPEYTRVDLLDASGRTLAAGVGAVDPTDAYTLVVPVTLPGDGLYTVDWRSLSAADGHVSSGFFTFGVGDVVAGRSTAQSSGGSIHAGHDATTTLVETEARLASSLGFLLAFGMPVIGLAVLRRPKSRSVVRIAAAALLIGAAGSASLIVLVGATPGLDIVAYVTGGHSGQLLVVRTLVGLVGASIALALRRMGRPGSGSVVAATAGAIGLLAIAAGGHAAAYASMIPVVVVAVHLGSAAIWVSGLLTLGWFATLGRRADRPLAALVPRFSALALVCVGLVVLTGAYSDWLQTRSMLSLDTPYEATLAIKIAIAATAFGVGALNFLGGGRDQGRLARAGGFEARIAIESMLAIGILVVTAVLASGSPPAQERPIELARATSSALGSGPPARLATVPGRPGPARFIADIPAGALPSPAAVSLHLQRLDGSGDTTIPMRAGPPTGSDTSTWTSDGNLLPADSHWDATVIAKDAHDVETGRTRFVFGLDATSIDEGLATPPIDPFLVIGLVLIALAVAGAIIVVARVRLPRVDAPVARWAIAVGTMVAGVLGIAIILSGSPA